MNSYNFTDTTKSLNNSNRDNITFDIPANNRIDAMLPSRDRSMYDALVNSICNDGAKALVSDDMASEIEHSTVFNVSGSKNSSDAALQPMVPNDNW